MKFNNASARSYTWVTAIPDTPTGWAEKWLRAALQRETWWWWLMKSSASAGNEHSRPRKLMEPWAASKGTWAAGKGVDSNPPALLLWDPTCSAEHSSGVPNVRPWNCWSKSRGHNVDKRTGAPSLQREAEKVGAVQPAERRLRPHRNLPVSEGATGKLERNTSSGTVVTGQGVTGSNCKMANLA